jgi:hypothetical protein
MAESKCGFTDVPGGATGDKLLMAYGPTLLVDIGFDPSYKIVQPGQQIPPPPVPGITNIRTLVDTGASQSCIDSLLAAQLNLPIVDRSRVSGAHGSQEVNIHLAQIRVPSLNATIYGVFAGCI